MKYGLLPSSFDFGSLPVCFFFSGLWWTSCGGHFFGTDFLPCPNLCRCYVLRFVRLGPQRASSDLMPIVVFLLVVPVLGLVLLLINWLLAPSRPDAQKASAYECGFTPVEGQTRAPFPVAFYLVGLLFMLFDLEVLLLFPFAQARLIMDGFGLATALIFLGALIIGFIFELGSGAIKFTERDSR